MGGGADGIRLALAGDTMLGRGVAAELDRDPRHAPVAPDVVELIRAADLCVVNLECCLSDRGSPWADPRKPFFFRGPPRAAELLAEIGVDCVTLANNHALDYGPVALVDTLDHLDAAGVGHVGAGRDLHEARAPRLLEAAGGFRLAVVAAGDHPAAYAAGPARPGIAYADLRDGALPQWLWETVSQPTGSPDALMVSPHWGPNMTPAPPPNVRSAAGALVRAGAAVVAGHSAHVFHGVCGRVLFDLGDFVDDYRVDPVLRNDLGALFVVELGREGPRRIEVVPLKLDYAHTRRAHGEDAAWVARRLERACAALGSSVEHAGDRLVVRPTVAL